MKLRLGASIRDRAPANERGRDGEREKDRVGEIQSEKGRERERETEYRTRKRSPSFSFCQQFLIGAKGCSPINKPYVFIFPSTEPTKLVEPIHTTHNCSKTHQQHFMLLLICTVFVDLSRIPQTVSIYLGFWKNTHSEIHLHVRETKLFLMNKKSYKLFFINPLLSLFFVESFHIYDIDNLLFSSSIFFSYSHVMFIANINRKVTQNKL